jgi:hypothetical protein
MEELTTQDLEAITRNLKANLKKANTEELLALMRKTDAELIGILFDLGII